MVACFDELYIRQRVRPARVGRRTGRPGDRRVLREHRDGADRVGVGAGGHRPAGRATPGSHHRDELRRRTQARTGRRRHRGGRSPLVLLAYPVWFFLAGPAHLSGMVWSTNVPGNLGNSISNLWSTPRASGARSVPRYWPRRRPPSAATGGRPARPPRTWGRACCLVIVAGTLCVAIGSPALVLRSPRCAHRRAQPPGRRRPVGAVGGRLPPSPLRRRGPVAVRRRLRALRRGDDRDHRRSLEVGRHRAGSPRCAASTPGGGRRPTATGGRGRRCRARWPWRWPWWRWSR